MQLSIIIPVYQVEKTLDRCVESVITQSFTDFEVILVDDGSPDHSPELCDDWAKKDARIRVIHKENGGLSDARNAGIDVASGDYLTFIDSDDYIEEGTLAGVMGAVADNDIVEYPIERFCGSANQSLLTFMPKVYDNMEAYWLTEHAYKHTYACNKIYRRALFDHVRFPKGKVFEDMHTLPSLLQKAHRVATTDQGLYHYCWNDNGITNTADGQALKSLLQANLNVNWMDDLYYMHVLNIQISVYERVRNEVQLPYRPVHIGTKGLRIAEKIKAGLLRVLGVKGVCELFYTLHKINLV